jgi:hypothetical protein
MLTNRTKQTEGSFSASRDAVTDAVREPSIRVTSAAWVTSLRFYRTSRARHDSLFFVVSRYAQLPELADKAARVWGDDTNQMAAAPVHGEAMQVFSEAVAARIEDGMAARAAVRGTTPL